MERRTSRGRNKEECRVKLDWFWLFFSHFVALLSTVWLFLSQFLTFFIPCYTRKCDAMSLPACAPAALLQKIVPRSNPLKESSGRVEPLVVRLCPVNLHLTNKTSLISLNISLIF